MTLLNRYVYDSYILNKLRFYVCFCDLTFSLVCTELIL